MSQGNKAPAHFHCIYFYPSPPTRYTLRGRVFYALVDFVFREPEALEVLPLLGARRAGRLLGNAEGGEAALPQQLPPPTKNRKGAQIEWTIAHQTTDYFHAFFFRARVSGFCSSCGHTTQPLLRTGPASFIASSRADASAGLRMPHASAPPTNVKEKAAKQ